MEMARGAPGIERFQLERRTAERLRDPRPGDDRRDGKADVARHLGRGDEQEGQGAGGQREDAHQALTSARPMWPSALRAVDSRRCAAFSAPPIAPGILNTMSSDARAKRWWTGVKPSCSRARPTDS